MTRERTTWDSNEIKRVAAMPKQADPYLMNQDHVSQNPRADKYMNGTPSSWAEDVHSPNEWESEYANGQTKRNEIGEPDFRGETFNHPEKTASNALLVKKADLTVKISRLMMPKAAEAVVEDQAVALMSLPDSDLIETFHRLAQDQEGQEQAPPAQQQAAQQGEEEEQAPPAQEQQQAGMQQQSAAYQQAAQQCMQAMQQGDQQKMQSAMQQMVQEAMKQQQGGQADAPGGQFGKNSPVASIKKSQQDQGQGQGQQQQQQQAAQVQQDQQQQAGMQDQAGMQQQALQQQIEALQQQMQQMQQAGQQQAPTQQEPMLAHDDMLLDEMLAPGGGGSDMSGMGDMADIELEPSPMDVGEVGLGPEDDVLKTLFANQETQDAQQAQQIQEGQGQQVQASVLRSSATRTVGTRPTVGVSKVGGSSAPSMKVASNDIDKLSNLWSSAPDVREHFGLK